MTKHPPLFRKVLVATDFSDCSAQALQQALWLAERMDTEIEIVHVLNDLRSQLSSLPATVMRELVEGDIDAFEQALRADSDGKLESIVAPFRKQFPKMHYETLLGVPYLEITRKVNEAGHDLVLAGTHGKTRLKRALIGSTAERLVRTCPCPVWIVKNPHAGCLNSILVPVEGSEVCEKALRFAHHLALESGADFEILHVLDVPQELRRLYRDATGGEFAIGRHRSVLRSAVDARLQHFVMRSLPEAIGLPLHILQGEAATVILKRARAISAELIVMGTAARRGLPAAFLGSTAEKVLRSFSGSILAIKPDGFVCPVEPSYRITFPQVTTGKE